MGGPSVLLFHKRMQIWGGHETARSMMCCNRKVKRDAIPTTSGLIPAQGVNPLTPSRLRFSSLTLQGSLGRYHTARFYNCRVPILTQDNPQTLRRRLQLSEFGWEIVGSRVNRIASFRVRSLSNEPCMDFHVEIWWEILSLGHTLYPPSWKVGLERSLENGLCPGPMGRTGHHEAGQILRERFEAGCASQGFFRIANEGAKNKCLQVST